MNKKQFDTTRKALKTFDLETIWKNHEEEGITTLFLSHDGENTLKLGCKCTNSAYERIDVETEECDIFTFAVILMYINENPFFDDKEVRITEIGAFRY